MSRCSPVGCPRGFSWSEEGPVQFHYRVLLKRVNAGHPVTPAPPQTLPFTNKSLLLSLIHQEEPLLFEIQERIFFFPHSQDFFLPCSNLAPGAFLPAACIATSSALPSPASKPSSIPSSSSSPFCCSSVLGWLPASNRLSPAPTLFYFPPRYK